MTLETLRKQIDHLNAEIIALFSKRLALAIQIAKIKKESGLPIYDLKREESQRVKLQELAEEHDLSPVVIDEMFTLFIEYTKLKEKMETE